MKLPPKKHFELFENVRASGTYNMITHARTVAEIIGLSMKRYFAVLENYNALNKKYPDVRKKVK